MTTNRPLSRRELVTYAGAAAVAVALGDAPALAQGVRKGYSYWPFRMGIQSYSLRGFKFDEALEKSRKLGLQYWEAFQAHVPMTDSVEIAKATLDVFKSRNTRLMAWGVQGFDGNEVNARKVFEFAKLFKVECITADPSKESFVILDKLVEEYKINIGIHNHGPGARYDKISDCEMAIKDHHPRIGACVDTGHYLRSGEDPVEAVERFGKRVYSVHLKDVKDKTKFTVVGAGDLQTVDLLRALKKLKYNGIVALEYEENPEDPVMDIDRCLAATRDAVSKVNNMP